MNVMKSLKVLLSIWMFFFSCRFQQPEFTVPNLIFFRTCFSGQGSHGSDSCLYQLLEKYGLFLVGGWTTHLKNNENILVVKLDSSSPSRGEHQKYLSCHHLVLSLSMFFFRIKIFTSSPQVIVCTNLRQTVAQAHACYEPLIFFVSFPSWINETNGKVTENSWLP